MLRLLHLLPLLLLRLLSQLSLSSSLSLSASVSNPSRLRLLCSESRPSHAASGFSLRLFCPQLGGLLCFENCSPTPDCLRHPDCRLWGCNVSSVSGRLTFEFEFDSATASGEYECRRGVDTDRLTVSSTVRPTVRPTVKQTVSSTVRPTVSSTVSSTVRPTVKQTVSSASNSVSDSVSLTVSDSASLTVSDSVSPSASDRDRQKKMKRIWQNGLGNAGSTLVAIATVSVFLLIGVTSAVLLFCCCKKPEATSSSPEDAEKMMTNTNTRI